MFTLLFWNLVAIKMCYRFIEMIFKKILIKTTFSPLTMKHNVWKDCCIQSNRRLCIFSFLSKSFFCFFLHVSLPTVVPFFHMGAITFLGDHRGSILLIQAETNRLGELVRKIAWGDCSCDVRKPYNDPVLNLSSKSQPFKQNAI